MTTRDPLDGKLVTLIGGSGFIGTHDSQLIRRNPELGGRVGASGVRSGKLALPVLFFRRSRASTLATRLP